MAFPTSAATLLDTIVPGRCSEVAASATFLTLISLTADPSRRDSPHLAAAVHCLQTLPDSIQEVIFIRYAKSR